MKKVKILISSLALTLTFSSVVFSMSKKDDNEIKKSQITEQKTKTSVEGMLLSVSERDDIIFTQAKKEFMIHIVNLFMLKVIECGKNTNNKKLRQQIFIEILDEKNSNKIFDRILKKTLKKYVNDLSTLKIEEYIKITEQQMSEKIKMLKNFFKTNPNIFSNNIACMEIEEPCTLKKIIDDISEIFNKYYYEKLKPILEKEKQIEEQLCSEILKKEKIDNGDLMKINDVSPYTNMSNLLKYFKRCNKNFIRFLFLNKNNEKYATISDMINTHRKDNTYLKGNAPIKSDKIERVYDVIYNPTNIIGSYLTNINEFTKFFYEDEIKDVPYVFILEKKILENTIKIITKYLYNILEKTKELENSYKTFGDYFKEIIEVITYYPRLNLESFDDYFKKIINIIMKNDKNLNVEYKDKKTNDVLEQLANKDIFEIEEKIEQFEESEKNKQNTKSLNNETFKNFVKNTIKENINSTMFYNKKDEKLNANEAKEIIKDTVIKTLQYLRNSKLDIDYSDDLLKSMLENLLDENLEYPLNFKNLLCCEEVKNLFNYDKIQKFIKDKIEKDLIYFLFYSNHLDPYEIVEIIEIIKKIKIELSNYLKEIGLHNVYPEKILENTFKKEFSKWYNNVKIDKFFNYKEIDELLDNELIQKFIDKKLKKYMKINNDKKEKELIEEIKIKLSKYLEENFKINKNYSKDYLNYRLKNILKKLLKQNQTIK